MQAARGTSLSTRRTSRGPTPRSQALTVFALTAACLYAVDQVTKEMAVALLEPGERVSVVGDLLTLVLVRNPGAAFGLGADYTRVFSVVAIIAVVVVLGVASRLGNRLWGVGLGLLLAGVLGNLTDRLVRPPGALEGHVVDFLALPSWPVFNVADVCINAAVVVILVQALRGIRVDGRRVTSSADDAGES